jgi:hypothetical protein
MIWFLDGTHDVFWLSGIAGTGKTTIAHSVCTMLQDHFGGAFFFSRESTDRRRPSNVIPTLSYQLAYSRPTLKEYLCGVISEDPDIASKAVQTQAQKLINHAFRNMGSRRIAPLLFVIDALDECDQENGQEGGLLVPLLIHHLRSLPFKVKIFITSRPEDSIRQMLEDPTASIQPFILHRIEDSVVKADIQLYLHHEFAGIVKARRIEERPWPTEAQIGQLGEQADRFFIYASTSIKFILNSRHPKQQLLALLSANAHSDTLRSPHAALDGLYLQVIRRVEKHTGTCEAFRDILGAIVRLQQPLSERALTALLRKDLDTVRGILQPLYSVLDVETADEPIRVFHPSFPDFLVDPGRCTDDDYCVNVQHANDLLALRCFQAMNKHLREDICEIKDSSLLNTEVADLANRLKECLPDEVRYACEYWIDHLVLVETINDDLQREFKTFCERHILHWIEVLSLLGLLRSAVHGLPQVLEWCKVRTGSTINA